MGYGSTSVPYSWLGPAVTAAYNYYDWYSGGRFRDLVNTARDIHEVWPYSRTETETEEKRKRRRSNMSSYQQDRRKYYGGKRLRPDKYIDRITSRAIVHQVERFSKVSDPSDTPGNNRGSEWLNYGDDNQFTYNVYAQNASAPTACTVTQYPVHLYNLTTTRCNPSLLNLTQGCVGWKLAICRTGLPNQVVWLRMAGWDRTTVVNPGSYPVGNIQEWEVEDTGVVGGQGLNLGRKALLEWSECRALLYGKKRRPTRVTFSFVTFPDNVYAPDFQWYDNGQGVPKIVDNDASEYWKTVAQPLVNNPCTITKRLITQKAMRVITSHTVSIEPKDSSDVDTDPFQAYRRWFNRWNKRLSYSYENTAQLSNDQVQDPQQYPNTATDGAVSGACKFPTGLKGCVYFMVTSQQPDKQDIAADGTGVTNEFTASYDYNLRKSTAVLEA